MKGYHIDQLGQPEACNVHSDCHEVQQRHQQMTSFEQSDHPELGPVFITF